MKKAALLAYSILIVLTGQAQTLKWAYSFTANSTREAPLGISSNNKDRFVISGNDIKGLNLDVKNGQSGHDADNSFIAVYNENAEIIWSVAGVDPANFKKFVWNVHMDEESNVYSLGRFGGAKLDFDPGSAKDEKSPSPLGSLFVQKFDKDGNYQWAKVLPFPGMPDEVIEGQNGNIIIAGKTNNDTSVVTKDNRTINMTTGIFILEMNSEGEIINAGCGAAGFNTTIYDLHQDASGNIVICGRIGGEVDFDLGAGVANDTSNRAIDAFVACYDNNLNLKWKKVFGDASGLAPSWDGATGLGSNESGDIFVGGYFTYFTDFDPDDNPGKFIFEADDRSQSPDGFILKYNKSGELQWVKQLGGEVHAPGLNNDVAIGNLKVVDNHIFVSGELTGIGDFDPSGDSALLHADDNTTCMFYGMYSDQGEYETAFIIDDTINHKTASGVENAYDIEVFKGALYSFGTFQKWVDFDPNVGEHILTTDPSNSTNGAGKDFYIAKWEMYTTTPGNVAGLKSSGALRVYPNPANTSLTIASKQGIGSYILFDLNGRIVDKGDVSESGVSTLSIIGWQAGTYLLQFNQRGLKHYQRVVIIH